MSPPDLRINDELSIDESELRLRTSTSRGPGGQHVNRSQTRVTVLFNVDRSASLDARQRDRLHERLGERIAADGTIRVSCQRHRSQFRNREGAIARLVELLDEALREDPPRTPTKVPRTVRKRRVDEKRQRGQTKKLRRAPSTED
jgi:ribosome-associated protein